MKILVRDKDGIRELEEGYADESELQRFLKEHADLMPLEDVDLTAPPLLCIGWEVGVVSGAEDILYIDRSGLLAVVETKLRKNPESRREVVGQILEYAAQMSAWTDADVERQAEKFFSSEHSSAEFQGNSLRQAMEAHARTTSDEGFEYEPFLRDVQKNIDAGEFRLVIAIDEAPEPLLKTVEFVNRFSKHFELYLVQLKRFTDSATNADIFVPAIFGRVSAPPSGTGSPVRRWDHDSFFDELRRTEDDPVVEYVTRVYEEFSKWTDEPLWGSGTTYGSFNLVVHVQDVRVNLAAITTNGVLYIYFEHMTSKLPDAIIESLRSDLASIDGVSLPQDVSRKAPRIPETVLLNRQRLAKVLATIKKTVDSIRSA